MRTARRRAGTLEPASSRPASTTRSGHEAGYALGLSRDRARRPRAARRRHGADLADEADRQRCRLPASCSDRVTAKGEMRRGHGRLVRAGRRGQRLVSRRGHDGVRAAAGRCRRPARGKPAATAPRPGSSCPRSPPSGRRTGRSSARARPRTRRRSSASVSRSRSPRGRYRDVLMTSDFNPARAAWCSSTSSTPAASGPVLTLDISGGAGREECSFEPAPPEAGGRAAAPA